MYVTVVIALLLWQIVRWRFAAAPGLQLRQLGAPGLVPAFAWALVAVFLAQLWTLAFEAHHQVAPICYARLPIPVVADLGPKIGGEAMVAPGTALMSFALIQSMLLACMAAAVQQRRPTLWEWRLVGIAIGCCFAAAFFAPAMTSPDPYLYFTFAKLGFGSFASGPHKAVVPDLPLSTWWCGPQVLLPSAYGPGFISYAQALVGHVHNVAAAIFIFRGANVAWLLLCVALFRKLKAPAATLALFAINPTVLYQYVANAHNDLIPVALVLGAVAIAFVPLGVIAVAAAGLVKLPFLVAGALSFAYESSIVRRVLAAAAALLLGFGASYLLGGSQYFAGLVWYRPLLSSTGDRWQIVLAAAFLLLLAVAVVYRRYFPVGAFTVTGLAVAEIQPWYVLWGLPYAALERNNLASFLAALPVLAFLMDDSTPPLLQKVLFCVVMVVIAVFALRDLLHGIALGSRRPPSEEKTSLG